MLNDAKIELNYKNSKKPNRQIDLIKYFIRVELLLNNNKLQSSLSLKYNRLIFNGKTPDYRYGNHCTK